jgi:hypothetical protein
MRLAAAVDRALEKDPAQRFGSMDQFAWELRQCLTEMNSPDAERTFVVPSSMVKESRPRHVRTRRRGSPFAALVVLAALAAIVAGVLALGGSKGNPHRAAAAAGRVLLHGTGNFDPEGSDTHAGTAPQATDGDPSTYWYTQTYATPSFGGLKSGLGLVLDAGHAVKLTSITVTTTTPGFSAEILAGNSLGSRPVVDSATHTVAGPTTFALRGASGRYYVLWITRLPPGGSARVNEVTATR